ncbi:MAG: TetR/AcrR family transcriptional regulator [Ruminococcus sp.]|uniref:TetR/AcrR family transcriptional regulator n=1 Tax=Ruminococcus sp. TaxID=41978 RepID=UPI002600EE6B|nr:TetR/AcrR family transcriptional regulator [Ruminococcus sp.]MBO4866297.1 TetR/AcrR family transcriptional regulator [Ruminococcus sp.]
MPRKQKRDLEATKKALLEAAKELMTTCTDSDEVTSRRVAAKAQVNPAMINYCYGSRENLLYEVFKQLLSDAQRACPELSEVLHADIPAKQHLITLHFSMMKLMIRNFSYSKAITKYILLNRTDSIGMESLPYILDHFDGRKSLEECKLIAFELSSLHELAVLRHTELKELFGIDFTEDDALMAYIINNVERFLDK